MRRREQREDLVDLRMRQAGHRLVGDEELGLGGQGARQFELAHLDLGQIARPAVGLVGEADDAQQLGAALADRGLAETRAACAERSPCRAAECASSRATVMLRNGRGSWKLRARPSRVR